MVTLIGRSFGRIAGLLAAILGLLMAFQIALIAVASSFTTASTLDRLVQIMPGFIQNAFGPALLSFAGMTTIGYFHPVAVMLVVQFAIFLATEPAGEIEAGLVDLVLARPLPRHWLVSRSLLVMTSCTVAATLAMWLGTWLGLWSLAPQDARWPDAHVVLMLTAHLAAVGWCFGAAALAAAAWARRRASAHATVALAAVALYLIDIVVESWPPAAPFARLSLFHYFHGAAILRGTANSVLDLSVLGAIALTGIALAYWKFHTRDL